MRLQDGLTSGGVPWVLPDWAQSWLAIAIVTRQRAKEGRSLSSEGKVGPSRGRLRAGRAQGRRPRGCWRPPRGWCQDPFSGGSQHRSSRPPEAEGGGSWCPGVPGWPCVLRAQAAPTKPIPRRLGGAVRGGRRRRRGSSAGGQRVGSGRAAGVKGRYEHGTFVYISVEPVAVRRLLKGGKREGRSRAIGG